MVLLSVSVSAPLFYFGCCTLAANGRRWDLQVGWAGEGLHFSPSPRLQSRRRGFRGSTTQSFFQGSRNRAWYPWIGWLDKLYLTCRWATSSLVPRLKMAGVLRRLGTVSGRSSAFGKPLLFCLAYLGWGDRLPRLGTRWPGCEGSCKSPSKV